MEDISIWQLIALYLITFSVFMAIDLVWLGVLARDRYRKALKKFMVKKFKPERALSFYALYIVGMLVMVLVPAINDDSLGQAMFYGTAYGFFTYLTYGLTNWSVVKDWPTRITFEDIAWGTFLSFAVATISYNAYIAIFV